MTATSPFSVRRSKGRKVMNQGRGTRAKAKPQGTAGVTRLREGRKDCACNSALLCAPQESVPGEVNYTLTHNGLCTKRYSTVFPYFLYYSSYSDIRNAVSITIANTEIEQD